MKVLIKRSNTYLLILSFVIIGLSVTYLNNSNGMSDILSDNFSFFERNTDTPVGNVYLVSFDGERFIPEKIYIYKNDVIQFSNTSSATYTLEGFGNSSEYVLNQGDDFFRKFSENNDFVISAKNVSNRPKLYIKVK